MLDGLRRFPVSTIEDHPDRRYASAFAFSSFGEAPKLLDGGGDQRPSEFSNLAGGPIWRPLDPSTCLASTRHLFFLSWIQNR